MIEEIKRFALSAIVIIIKDIMEIDIIIPSLVFDYSENEYLDWGYYMYQNIAGDMITLNMKSLLELKNINDIKTVITYGFIHEIMHLYQKNIVDYNTNRQAIEDVADYNTIRFINEYKDIIEKRLCFPFNDRYIDGIERQLVFGKNANINYNNFVAYNIKTIVGAICDKIDYNFQYLYNYIYSATHSKTFSLCVVFPNKREFYIDLMYGTPDDLNLLINLIRLTDYKFIKVESYTDNILIRLLDIREG